MQRGNLLRVVVLLVVIYVGGWLAVSVAVYAAGRRLTDRESPATHPLMLSLAAGAAWPLLVVGLVELPEIVERRPGPRNQPKSAAKFLVL